MHNAINVHPHHTSQRRRVVGSQDHRASHTVSLTDCADTGGSPPQEWRYFRSAFYPFLSMTVCVPGQAQTFVTAWLNLRRLAVAYCERGRLGGQRIWKR